MTARDDLLAHLQSGCTTPVSYTHLGVYKRQGMFQITSIEYAGSHNGEAAFAMWLASARDPSFPAL